MSPREHDNTDETTSGNRASAVLLTVIGAIIGTGLFDFTAMGIGLVEADTGRHVVAPHHGSPIVGFLAFDAPLIVLTVGGSASCVAHRWSLWVASCWLAALALLAPFALLVFS